jgi:hypothetical protein
MSQNKSALRDVEYNCKNNYPFFISDLLWIKFENLYINYNPILYILKLFKKLYTSIYQYFDSD